MKYSHPPNYLKKIKDSRTRFGLTQQRMAELRGVSFAFVYRWVNGQTRPSSLTWQRITQAEVLGVEALSKDYAVDEKPTHIVRDDQVPYEVVEEQERILDFSSPAERVPIAAEGERLAYGHLLINIGLTQLQNLLQVRNFYNI